jgi:hypothetical protein
MLRKHEMIKDIDKMETWEIANYLVFQRGVFIPTFFTRQSIHSLFGFEFNDNEWKELIDFCERDDEHLWEYVERKLDMWRSRNERRSFPDDQEEND